MGMDPLIINSFGSHNIWIPLCLTIYWLKHDNNIILELCPRFEERALCTSPTLATLVICWRRKRTPFYHRKMSIYVSSDFDIFSIERELFDKELFCWFSDFLRLEIVDIYSIILFPFSSHCASVNSAIRRQFAFDSEFLFVLFPVSTDRLRNNNYRKLFSFHFDIVKKNISPIPPFPLNSTDFEL